MMLDGDDLELVMLLAEYKLKEEAGFWVGFNAVEHFVMALRCDLFVGVVEDERSLNAVPSDTVDRM